MYREEAMDILRQLARYGADASPVSLSGLVDTIRRDWPDSFADTLPEPSDLIGLSSPMSSRDVHLQGLQQVIEKRLAPANDNGMAKLRYHARWLLYLGEPEHEAPPKVSIIIPIYNRAWLVDSLIQNCLDQTYSRTEIVVVDDGSTDDTAARLAAFGDRIKLIQQSNAGVSAARNAGVLAATGDLLQFLDSDDLLDAEHVEAKVSGFAAIPDADVCYCSAMDVSLFGVKPSLRQGQAYTVREEDTSPTTDFLASILAHGLPFLVSAVTMPRHAFLHYGFFDTDLHRAEDARYWFGLALGRAKVIGLARRLLYRCRMTDGLHETRHVDDTHSIIRCLRDVMDLLRRPEQWPAVAEYLSRTLFGKHWDLLLDSEPGAYGRDSDILLETIADLPRAGRDSARSPLPLLIFLWMLNERSRTPRDAVSPGLSSLRERFGDALVRAMVCAEPLGQVEKDDWTSRGPKLRAKRRFVELLRTESTQDLSSRVRAKFDEAAAFLRSLTGVKQGTIVCTPHAPQEKRPLATVVVPVLADPAAAEATIASCFAQTVSNPIEILAIETDELRAAFWAERYPKLRVITVQPAEGLVQAHTAGLAAAKSDLIRFLLPGDILASHSLAEQIKTSKSFHNEFAVVEIKVPSSDHSIASIRPLKLSPEGQPQTIFSATLFPRSVLVRVGGFDLVLGEAYQARYLFRLMAAGVSVAFISVMRSSRYAKPLTGSAGQFGIAALANLIQCLGNQQLWRHIPAVVRSTRESAAVKDRGLHSLKNRVLDFTFKAIDEISRENRSPLAALTLCLVGLEWGRLKPNLNPSEPLLEAMRSAILNMTSGLSLDTLGRLSLSEALGEADGDPSFGKAIKRVLKAVHEGAQYVGLRDALQHLQEGTRVRESCQSSF